MQGLQPEGGSWQDLQTVRLQFRTLHASNRKIIAAAQAQVSAMHDEYQKMEEGLQTRHCISF